MAENQTNDDTVAMTRWQLNGQEVESPTGMTIMEAAKEHGIEIPCFCYHPGLSIAGNCRICMVESNRSPKPVISCSEKIADGLEIETESELAVSSRNSVMEFQLINHPLDCPVCDKAGECTLQDHSYKHGPDRSRFVEDKNIRHTKELGPTISIWGNRCIVCTRCIRFCDEISGTSELCIVERGDRSVVDVFPEIPIDNQMAGNTVDICPVGALISHDFKYEARVWNMDRKDSVCGGCSRGCNVEVETLDGFVKRLMPRENLEVNDWWMCDEGRYGWRHLYADDRLTQATQDGASLADDSATAALEQLLCDSGPVAFLIDPYLTCEEMHLVQGLAASRPGSSVGGWLPEDGNAASFPSGFTISAAKYPNRAGAEHIFGDQVFGDDAKELQKSLVSSDFTTVVAFCGGHLPNGPGESWAKALSSTPTRILFSVKNGPWLEGASLVLPATAPIEKEGTWINEDGRLQRTRSCWNPGTEPFSVELVRLQTLQNALGIRGRNLSSAGIFRELAATHDSFAGHNHSDLGSPGLLLSQRPAGISMDGGSE
ncbi:MAG: 2Fe-2S iron-sulfur cluster-binding protein [Planctomycetota bacterium]|nr:2Fe-2S iron-sulfur cluster-binding protein [Planctomycetota bacterium]